MRILYIFSLLGLLAISGFNFHSSTNDQESTNTISEIYSDDFHLFQKEVSELAELAAQEQTQFDLSDLRQQYLATRIAYKRIEFLFDYHTTEFNYLFINGGPFIKYHEDFIDLIEPRGLQCLDELMFTEDASTQLAAIEKLASDLRNDVNHIAPTYLSFRSKTTDYQMIEALRSGIVRLFTLGLTGFDTPGSNQYVIQEAVVSMQAMEKAFLSFAEELDPMAEPVFREIKNIYRGALNFLEADHDFNTFDRMGFLKQVINPLYEKLLDFQNKNDIRTKSFKYHAQDYSSQNLFDENFLNTDYYSKFSFLPLNDPAAIQLGKSLFFDPVLSKDEKMSCATCHDPAQAFTDGLPKSQANVPGKYTKRNAPTLIDAGYSSRYFWDLREYELERQVAHVVKDSLEFNNRFSVIVKRLSQDSNYIQMFEQIYRGIAKQPIYSRSISHAIASYVNSLKSFNSEFDRYVRNEIAHYPEEAIRGFNLFMGKAACGTCHFAPVFNGTVPPFYTETESEVLGLTMGLDTINPIKDQDPGRIMNGKKREALPQFEHSFKTVTVRNTGLTAPYMHNGLFKTLEEVMEFYNRGGGAGMGLDIKNQTLSDAPLNLSKKEQAEIISFLHTLTDTTGLTYY